MARHIDIELSDAERKAFFSLLYAMAKADGHIALSEEGLLRKVHRELFDGELSTWVQPQDFEPGAAARALASPEARGKLLSVLYEMMLVDGLELDDEMALFATCGRQIGLDDPVVREVWITAAREIHARATRDLVRRRFTALGRELARLRNNLFLDDKADRAAQHIVRQELEHFEVP